MKFHMHNEKVIKYLSISQSPFMIEYHGISESGTA